jgi:hypothetical protein
MKIKSKTLARILMVVLVVLFSEITFITSFIHAKDPLIQKAPQNPEFVAYINNLKKGQVLLRPIPK